MFPVANRCTKFEVYSLPLAVPEMFYGPKNLQVSADADPRAQSPFMTYTRLDAECDQQVSVESLIGY